MLNGNGVEGSASTASYLLGQRGYRMLAPPNGLPANAPTLRLLPHGGLLRPERRRAPSRRPRKLANLFGSADVKKLTPTIRALGNDAMLVAVVGQTFHGRLAAAPVDQTPKRQPANVVSGATAVVDLLRERRKRDRVPVDGADGDRALVVDRPRAADPGLPDRPDKKHKTVRLTYKMGSNEYWGVQMTDWEDAPVLAGRNFVRNIGGRRYELYYNGPRLHMVVLKHRRRVLLGRQHAARPALERDDDRDREGPAPLATLQADVARRPRLSSAPR